MKQFIQRGVLLLLALLLCTASLFGCASPMERAVATTGDYEVLFEELRFVILTKRAEYQKKYGATVFDTPEGIEQHRAAFEAEVTETLKENYTVLAACRHYLPDLKLSDDKIVAEVDTLMESTVSEMGGQDAFDKYAADNFMTENLMRFTLAVYVMETHLLTELAARKEFFSASEESEFFAWIREGNGVYVQHLFIKNDEGESAEENRALAQQARELLLSGEKSIDSLVGNSLYNEDPLNTTPYYMIRGVYEQATEQAAFSLSEAGSVSQVTETEDGFYVFVRLEDSDNLLRQQIPSLLSSYQWAQTERIKETFREGVTFEWKESIDFFTVT